MRPEGVSAELVEKARQEIYERMPYGVGGASVMLLADQMARAALAAVLPLAQAAAQQELITDLLEREMWPMRHENDYPTGAVPKSALLSRRVQIAKRLREGSPS